MLFKGILQLAIGSSLERVSLSKRKKPLFSRPRPRTPETFDGIKAAGA